MDHQPTGEEDPLPSTILSPPSQSKQQRSLCTKCTRPLQVCLCHKIPQTPIPTETHIIILQHPHESTHRLNTANLLPKCILNTTTIVGRRLHRENLDPLLSNFPSPLIYYLFPPTTSSPAINISDLENSTPSSVGDNENTQTILIVFDATWQHAKEMVCASEGALERVGAKRVCLDGGIDESMDGENIYGLESGLVLRQEPFGGCVTTFEAVARCLRVVEGEMNGVYVERSLIEVLKEMVKLQKGFLKPIKPRPKMVKKGKQNKESFC
ncbi:hypothetical protein ACFE04_007710 [Oxalis oulophora]